jgi:raffinose/stachyose/melibiose transport system permease protein
MSATTHLSRRRKPAVQRPTMPGHKAPVPHSHRRARRHPWIFVLPAMAMFSVFFLAPTLLTFFYPFTNWSAFHSNIDVVGLKSFRSILHDGSLRNALQATLIYAFIVAVCQNLFGLGLALLLEEDTWLNRALRTVFFLPVLLSALAVGYVFRAFLTPDGALNHALSTITGAHITFAWLGSTTWTLVVVAVIHSWKWMGLSMLIYLAGLKAVPPELLEAARTDGAGAWRTFLAVKFPMLAPAVTFNVTLALIGTLNSFDIVQATTGGGPAEATQIFNVYMFRVFGEGLYAQAAAMSLVLFLVVTALAIPVIMFLRRRELSL